MAAETRPFDTACPIQEQDGGGRTCGRCWFHLRDGRTCPRHGDVSIAVSYYKESGKMMLEYHHAELRNAKREALRQSVGGAV